MDLDANGATRMGGAVGNEIKDFCGHAACYQRKERIPARVITVPNPTNRAAARS